MLKDTLSALMPIRIVTMMDNLVKRSRNMVRLKKARSEENGLTIYHIDSLELLEIIKKDLPNPIIYDVGAHIGTWTKLALAIFPNAEIQCFEPFPEHVKKCSELFNNTPNVRVHAIALGSANYEDNFNVASSTDASSLLNLSGDCKERYHLSITQKIKISVKKLDDYIIDNHLNPPNVLKLDIQGFELEALKGSAETLKKVDYILTEVSFTELYEKQAYFSDIVCYMQLYGFELCALSESTAIGKLLEQTDALFKKNKVN